MIPMQGYAVASKGLVNLRAEPAQQSELLSQYLVGEKFRVVGNEKNYYRIETGDDLKGWIHQSGIVLLDKIESEDDADNERQMICISHFSTLHSKECSDSQPVMRVFLGTVLKLDEPVTNYYLKNREWLKVKLPDGTSAFLNKSEFNVYSHYIERHYYNPKTAAEIASSLLGVSYLWGGTTPAALDCSGMVQLVCRMAGKYLPRNSYQQAETGAPIDAGDEFELLVPGDLLFFSEGERISHVGLSIGGARFIHSCQTFGSVVTTSIRKGETEYHKFFKEIFTFARRLNWNPQA